jgi:tetratricopeptide (TPR) repeat protein
LQAESLLSKAVKRDQSSITAWNSLATCFWKKGDKVTALSCLRSALAQSPNKQSYQLLSMLLRQIDPQEADEQEQVHIESQPSQVVATPGSSTSVPATTSSQSNKHSSQQHKREAILLESADASKRAVELDMSDGHSWYTHGNSYLALFFAHMENAEYLKQAHTAYTFAQRDAIENENNPDLHYNRGIVSLTQSPIFNCILDMACTFLKISRMCLRVFRSANSRSGMILPPHVSIEQHPSIPILTMPRPRLV